MFEIDAVRCISGYTGCICQLCLIVVSMNVHEKFLYRLGNGFKLCTPARLYNIYIFDRKTRRFVLSVLLEL